MEAGSTKLDTTEYNTLPLKLTFGDTSHNVLNAENLKAFRWYRWSKNGQDNYNISRFTNKKRKEEEQV
jgi:hypothetical protein